ncbi:hypothetical protein F5Y19DRAFT_491053 [Xylariaceae sp. FL1651]|nr:hypothetical protein F5Y19DRAFT_491053 [Xylariaceae sp. FL1651]
MQLPTLLSVAAIASQATLISFTYAIHSSRADENSRLPDASVAPRSVARDVTQIAAISAGGLQFLPFYNYGLGPALTDWSVYGFGTPAFVDVLSAALQECAAHGLQLDFALGPNQGAGVPSEPATPGLARELVYGNMTIESGESYDGDVPLPNIEFNQLAGFMGPLEFWGENELLAVVAGKIVAESFLSGYFSLSILDESSLIDLTDLTSVGKLKWTAPEGTGTWVIFGIYERNTLQRESVSVGNATTFIGNGSWKVDHYSALGAKKVTDFWDNYIFSDSRISDLIPLTRSYVWEDSIEMQAALFWTPDLASKFEEIHGYSVIKYLPLLFHATNQWNGYLPPYNVTYSLGGYRADGGPYIMDYKTALTSGYEDYISHFSNWASSKGMQYSNQPAYNEPVDMTASIPYVPVPELESLGFEESVGQYRKFTGAAHLANINTISTELGAVSGSAYKQRVTSLKALIDGSFSAGVNTFTIHGYAYSGEYIGTSWPGYTPFQYQYSELWNPRQPAWRHLDELMLYTARNTLIQKSGIPKIDVAFYYFEVGYVAGGSVYPDADMNTIGYTYEYLGPENLVSEETMVKDGILAPDGPAYKALVFVNQTHITPNASAALVRFANAGLPIYIVGTIPNITFGMGGQSEVSSNIAKLLGLETVRFMTADEFSPQVLLGDGVIPRASVHSSNDATSLYTFWTTDTKTGQDYVTINNAGPVGSFDMTFAVGESVPYMLNAWTGAQTQVAVYERVDGGIKMPVKLNQSQTAILAFTTSRDRTSVSTTHLVSHSPNVHEIFATPNNTFVARVSDNKAAWVQLSDGSRVFLPSSNGSQTQPVTTLGPWNLSIEAHGPSDDRTLEGNTTAINVGIIDHLLPWTQIPGIEHVSGMGTYTTTFEASGLRGSAVVVNFGPVLNTLKAWVNGKKVQYFDPADPVADVSGLLVEGTNELRVEVSSTLFNTVKANVDRVFSIGYGPYDKSLYTDAEWEEFGLVGPVTLQVYREVVLDI